MAHRPRRCSFSLHSWIPRQTARAGTTVYRCRRCGDALVLHRGRKRLRKRVWLPLALALLALLWVGSLAVLALIRGHGAGPA